MDSTAAQWPPPQVNEKPRYFCKTCRRYWTEGGSLRNIPVGGGSRKNKPSISTNLVPPPQNPKIHDFKALSEIISSSPPQQHLSLLADPYSSSLNFSLEGLVSGYGSFQGLPETSGKLLFPNNAPHQNGGDHGYWNGGGSW
ncbi:hypothetical protein SASPL_133000 [Salvia splendens]|uniref:Dof zinc finger protein n=1 Tax=Salvia splendens TaxID=180675 RepID=A0A8X8X1X5_SALSN|nr:hypothetical protein SASPL_133000 [Salvia splendens]